MPEGRRSGNNGMKYDCTQCGKSVGKDGLTVKRIEFSTMGRGYRKLKTRTVAWLCEECRNADPAWSREELTGSPGAQSIGWGKDK